MARKALVLVLAAGLISAAGPARAATEASADSSKQQYRARLQLVGDPDKGTTSVATRVMKPFDVYLVAARDSTEHDMMGVAFTLQVPDGILCLGEELLVQQIVIVGGVREGINVMFQCVDSPSVRIYHFRFVATHPLDDAVIRLTPDGRTRRMGVVSCQRPMYEKYDSEPASFHVTARP